MKKEILNFIFFGVVALPCFASYTGRVYVDKNFNGVYDKGEKVIPEVLVSDGLNVVKTQSDGTYVLPGHEREKFIYITTPSGYKTDNKHYIRIDKSKEHYDFGLQTYQNAVKKDGSHKYIHIADTEISSTYNHEVWSDELRNYAANEQVAFIIHTGDICYERGLKAHFKLMNTSNMNCPVFYAIGNHDLVKGKYGEELFESIYGPVYYSFDVGSTHYIVTPMEHGDYDPLYTRSDVYNWLKNDLAMLPKGKPIVVFNHDLLTYSDRFLYGISKEEQLDLNAHNLKAWVFGHWHINYIKKQGSVYAVSTASVDKGGIDHSTNAYRVMHVDKNGDFQSELRYSYLNKHLHISAPANNHVPVFKSGAVPLVVNTYSSDSPVREVLYTCVIDGKEIFAERKLQQATDWSWITEIPLKPEHLGKMITVQVFSYFKNGEVAHSTTVFKYTGKSPEVNLKDEWTNLLGNPAHAARQMKGFQSDLQLSWIANLGANVFMTSPVVSKGKIFLASMDENLKGEAYLFALDGKSGTILWKYQVRNSIKNSIALEDNLLYAQDCDGYVYAIDTEKGNLKWEVKLPIEGLPSLVEGLVVSEGVVYAGTGMGLSALDAKSGNVLWRNKEWKQSQGATATPSVSDETLISSSQWLGLFANDLKTGAFKWKKTNDGMLFRSASAAIHNELLYTISDCSLFVQDVKSGRVIMRKKFPFSVDVNSTPLLTDKEIIFGTVKDGLVALDKETFEIKWQFAVKTSLLCTVPYFRKESSMIETSPVWVGNIVYVAASDGTIYGIDKNNGSLVWNYTVGAPILSTVSVSGNALIAVDFGGNVYAFATGND